MWCLLDKTLLKVVYHTLRVMNHKIMSIQTVIQNQTRLNLKVMVSLAFASLDLYKNIFL